MTLVIDCGHLQINVAKKDAVDILEAYDSCSLKLTGNSCHLAPWHAKLGYHFSPVVSGLGSLTADGGPVAMMDLTIKKVTSLHHPEYMSLMRCRLSLLRSWSS
jgi:breast cancer 2 susceptibility protein